MPTTPEAKLVWRVQNISAEQDIINLRTERTDEKVKGKGEESQKESVHKEGNRTKIKEKKWMQDFLTNSSL